MHGFAYNTKMTASGMYTWQLCILERKIITPARDRSSNAVRMWHTYIGLTGSSNSRQRHVYCFGKFLCPPFRLFIMLKHDFFHILIFSGICGFYRHMRYPGTKLWLQIRYKNCNTVHFLEVCHLLNWEFLIWDVIYWFVCKAFGLYFHAPVQIYP